MLRNQKRLTELSVELEDLAGRLSALIREDVPQSPPLTPVLVRLVLALRLIGSDYFPAGLGEPARNMMLVLYAAQLDQQRLTPTRLAAASAVPLATALRWLDIMQERNLVRRSRDPSDRRLVRLALTPRAVAGIEAYLSAIFERRFLLP
jgi:DNA-binding MarR family transcriptional regulator